MICQYCGDEIPAGEENNYYGTILCEDCLIERLTKPKACDPLSVRSARITRKKFGQSGTEGLTPVQRKIYQYIKEKKRVTLHEVARELKISPEELEKQFAILRHCELVHGFKEADKVFFKIMN